MTYFSFLLVFLILPLLGFSLLTFFDARRDKAWFTSRAGKLAAGALLAHIVLAVTYTTPWDNYLVATRVWWYDPARVFGIIFGWVPLEEYLFFILQSFLTGLILFALMRRISPTTPTLNPNSLRLLSALVITGLWLISVFILALGWKPGTYLGLELAWALPPIGLQLAVGADSLWRYRRSVLITLASAILYLCAADFLAIRAGVWMIDPAQSLQVFVGGVLPIEEIIFFLLTNTLLVFGLTLALAPETWERWLRFKAALRRHVMSPEKA